MERGPVEREKAFIKSFWHLIGPYWVSEDKKAAWGLLTVVVALNLGIVYINVLLNRWMNGFYNALQNLEMKAFLNSLVEFSVLAAVFIATAVYMIYLNQMLQIRWRKWLTRRYLAKWLDGQIYYRMQIFERRTDNPDQRISEDIAALVEKTLNLGLGFLRAVVTLLSFIVILWELSGPLEIPLGGFGTVTIGGYMVWAALFYALFGTWLTMVIGNPLIKLNFNQQRLEADFRYGMIRLRENSENVAIYGGEAREMALFWGRFKLVVANFWRIMRQQKRLTWMTSTYNQLSAIFPLVVAAPRFFSGQIKLGGLMQISQAFGQVHDSLSFIVNSYVGIAEWKAVVDRLLTFTDTMKTIEEARSLERIKRRGTEEDAFAVRALDLFLPDGRVLVRGLSFHLRPGESLIVTGPSGCGKSTLLKAMAGLWPYGEGEIRYPEGKSCVFLSQRPYLPLGTLRDALTYPASNGDNDEELRDLLVAHGLTYLADHLDDTEPWSQTLSLGEQQRIAFIRALLHKPDYLFLDEATSSLDEETEARVYGSLKQRLPETVYFSVAHRSTLLPWHARRLALRGDGGWDEGPLLLPADSRS
ncbi:MAG TPA: ABC transporter ATP-binding protein/permease [Syntrophales bacterium]|nr:ABC transporter ATP-binding protein/permease [Syntrophales bacterium]